MFMGRKRMAAKPQLRGTGTSRRIDSFLYNRPSIPKFFDVDLAGSNLMGHHPASTRLQHVHRCQLSWQ